MIFVKTEDLKAGMRLAKPVYNRLGVLLYDRESELSAQAISSVQNFGLIGVYVLEPAEPAPPISPEEIAFERFQTIYIFRLKEALEQIQEGKRPKDLYSLAETIIQEYGALNYKFPFSQNLRSKEDYYYKHCLNVAILCAMISHVLKLDHENTVATVTAALLHDIGMLSLPDEIQDKNEKNLSQADIEIINHYMQQGYQLLQPITNPYDIPSLALRTVGQVCQIYYHPDHPQSHRIRFTIPSRILLLANAYDTMTAMNTNSAPTSDLYAIEFLKKHPEYYDTDVLTGLTESIQIIPRGCCVELSNGQKAMVVEENLQDFMAPVLLQFSDNRIIDLSHPETAKRLQIVEIMKTMDNRIKIDEETLKHFSTDRHLVSELEKIRRKRPRPQKKKPILR